MTFDWGIGSSGRSLLPVDLTINGNLISSTNTRLFEGAEGSGYIFADNIADGTTLGIGSRPGLQKSIHNWFKMPMASGDFPAQVPRSMEPLFQHCSPMT